MNRRKFVKTTSVVSIGALIAPSLFSCETLLFETNFKGKVIIIGSGAAGLYAGYILKQNNIPFIILEADSQPGGRTKFKSDFADFNIDLGAEWLHGGNSIFADFVEEKNVEVYLDKSDGKFWHENKVTDQLPSSINKVLRGVLDGDLPDISLLEYCKNQLGLEGDELNFVEFVAGEYGAAASELSVKWAGIEEENWNAGSKDFKFPKSLGHFINTYLIEALKDYIVLDSPVTDVDYSSDILKVSTAKGYDYSGQRIICSVPITQLQQNKIKFNPELTDVKKNAFREISMTPGMKIFMRFSKNFYGDGLLGATASPAYANAAYGKEAKDNVLMAFIMGTRANHLSSLGEKAIDELLDELSKIYGKVVRESYIDSYIHDWGKNEWVGGAYSFAPVGQTVGARARAAESLGNKVYFAGEAMNTNGHHQSVHGAMETGKKSVEAILSK